MITIVSGTNRAGSNALIISNLVKDILLKNGHKHVHVIDLRKIQYDIITDDMYNAKGQSKAVSNYQSEFLIPADRWIFVIPEYNGSYPGIFKLFLDALSANNYQKTFSERKIALIGIADGRGGNLRGLDQLTNSMHYLGSNVFYNKLPISQLERTLNEEGLIKPVEKDLVNMLSAFLAY